MHQIGKLWIYLDFKRLVVPCFVQLELTSLYLKVTVGESNLYQNRIQESDFLLLRLLRVHVAVTLYCSCNF